MVFVGSTTPSKVGSRLLEALKELCSFERQRSQLVVVNTDGWVSGGEAEELKVKLVCEVESEWVVGLQLSNELEPILGKLESKIKVLRLPASPAVRLRSRGERRDLRWQAYSKYLAGASILNLKAGRVKILGGKPSPGAILGLYGSDENFLGIGVVLVYNDRKGFLKILTPVKGFIDRIVVGEVLPDFTLKI